MGPLGLEPTQRIDTSNGQLANCVNDEEARAAPALHFRRLDWLELSSIDADLLSVVLAWEKIRGSVRKEICALVQEAILCKSSSLEPQS